MNVMAVQSPRPELEVTPARCAVTVAEQALKDASMCKHSEQSWDPSNDEAVEVTDDMPHLPTLPALQTRFPDGDAEAPNPLDGVWIGDDGSPVATIRGKSLVWSAGYVQMDVELDLSADGSVLMELEGQTYRGAFQAGPPSVLAWSDGEVWRLDENPGW
jgi:hypothetical protein